MIHKGSHTTTKPILFEIKSHENIHTDSPTKSEGSEGHKNYDDFLMSPDSFVKGKRLIDPVTGRVEGDDRSDDEYKMLEQSSVSSKRSKLGSESYMDISDKDDTSS